MSVEFLVRVKDKINSDSPELDSKCLKAGDVVVVCPGGWRWSDIERNNPEWMIVEVDDMDLDEARAFMSPEPGDPVVNRMLQKRSHHIEPAKLKKKMTADEVRGAKKLKAGLKDPKVFG